MKLAVLATAIFNNLLFHKAKLSTTIYYEDLNILKTGRVFQSVATVNGGLPYSRVSSKAPKRCCLQYPPRIQMAPSISRSGSQQTQILSPLQSTSIQPHHTGTGQKRVLWDILWSGITWRAMQVHARTPYTTSRPPVCIVLSHIDNPSLSPIEAEQRV
jgi:hypothetical protein